MLDAEARQVLQSIDDSMKQLVATLRRIEQTLCQGVSTQVHGAKPCWDNGKPLGGCGCSK